MIIVMLGKPGSGKGTQAELLAKRLKIPYITVGRLIRSYLADTDTPYAKKLRDKVNKGFLVPHQFTIRLVRKAVAGKKSFIFDGFPRSIAQARQIESFAKPDVVFYIDIPDSEVMRRLSQRYQCPSNHVYNLNRNPPKKDMICDKCGKKLFRRSDDNPQTLRNRLKVFRQETLPVLRFYRNRVVKIDGSRPIKKVQAELLSRLRKVL